jgi:hypothetical protein
MMKYVISAFNCADIDVYSETSWAHFEEERRKKLERNEDDVVSLSSDDEPPRRAVPSIRLRLQCDSAPVLEVRVEKVPFVSIVADLDHNYQNAGENIPKQEQNTFGEDDYFEPRWR